MGAALVLAIVCGFAVFRIDTNEEDVVERINAVYLLLLYSGLMALEFVTYCKIDPCGCSNSLRCAHKALFPA